jgi:NAD-dependent SIR2 family protein deacetylase
MVEKLRRDKPEVVEVLRLLPVCCECDAKILEPAIAWWGGKPVHLDCGKAAWARERKHAAHRGAGGEN